MARIDKYDPHSGGFRAALAADHLKTDGPIGGTRPPVGVGLDVNGRVVDGAGVTGVKGVLVLTRDMLAGEIVDVMTDGELVECGGAAGTNYYAHATGGVISTTATGTLLGMTVEAGRLVVRVKASTGAA